MAYWFAAILGALSIVLLVRLMLEWQRYARGGHIISGRHMALRVASAVVLVALLVMVLGGAARHFESPETALAYWGVAVLLALAAMTMALVDLSLLRRSYGRRRAEGFRRLSSYLRALDRRRDESGGSQ